MATVRVLLVAEIEVEDEGFASDYVREAVDRLDRLQASVLSVELAEHPELRAMFLPRIQAEPLRKPDGTALPLYYSGPKRP